MKKLLVVLRVWVGPQGLVLAPSKFADERRGKSIIEGPQSEAAPTVRKINIRIYGV